MYATMTMSGCGPQRFGPGRSAARRNAAWWWASRRHDADVPDEGGARDRPRAASRRAGRFGPPWAGGPFGQAGAKVRRGETRDAVLLLLLEGPKHGYQLMAELGERSNGRWNPSPGSVYPVVRSLAHAGLVDVEEGDGRRTFELTADGLAIAERRRDAGPPPWARFAEQPVDGAEGLRDAALRLLPVLRQLAADGDSPAIATITSRLETLRRDVYRLLADSSVTPDVTPDDAGDGQHGGEA